VNVSSGLGSIAINGDPNTPYYDAKVLAYNASKAALNMFTVDLAYDLRETTIKVNSACPGFTATDLNNHTGHQTVEEGATAIVRLAQLPDDGPTGSFIHKDGVYSW
jgi:NAD(P)-dependent dehydrogenase (short-subunit alcohol dehydrogenase family)